VDEPDAEVDARSGQSREAEDERQDGNHHRCAIW
jgi:hypothetical protein